MIPFVTNPSNQQGLLGYLQMGATYDPRTSTVLSSAFDEARSGRGSAINDVAAGVIARETGNTDQLSFFQPVSEFLNWATFGSMTPNEVDTIPSGVPMSEEEWKKSPYYVEGMPYLKGLTTQAAAIQFSLNQRQAENEFVMGHASRAQSVGAFGAGFVGSLADVKQLPLNVAAAAAVPFTAGASLELRAGTLFADGLLGWSAKAAATGEIGLATRVGSAWVSRVTTTGAKAIAATTPRALAGVAAEGVISTIPTVATAMANAPLTGQEYTFEDGVRDTLFSAAASGALHLTGTAIHAAWSKYARPADTLEIGRTALAQVAGGEKIDVEPLVRAAVADYTPDFYSPTVVPLGEGKGWMAKYGEKQGVAGEPIRVTAFTREEAERLAEEQFVSRITSQAKSPQEANLVALNLQLKKKVAAYDRGAEIGKLTDRTVEVRAAKEALALSEKELEQNPGRRVRTEPLRNMQGMLGALEQKVRSSPREYAAFDDRVLRAEKELATAKKALQKAGTGNKTAARERAVAEAQDNLDFAVERATSNIDELLNIIPEVRGLRQRVAELSDAANSPGIKLGKRETKRVRDVVNAKARVQEAMALVQPKVLERLDLERARLHEMLGKSEQTIRTIQSREAAKHLPDYARKQLDQSLEARAERSFDPQAVDAVQDRVPDVKYDDSAPPSSLTPEEATEFEQLAARVPESDVITRGDIKFLDVLKKSTDAVIDYAKCKAGV